MTTQKAPYTEIGKTSFGHTIAVVESAERGRFQVCNLGTGHRSQPREWDSAMRIAKAAVTQ